VREIQGINSSSVIEGKNGYYIQTLGVHINVLKELNFIKLNNFVSNDVYWMSQRLGVCIFIYRLKELDQLLLEKLLIFLVPMVLLLIIDICI
jgi:hypothetical protein